MEENERPWVAPKRHECPMDYMFAKFIMNVARFWMASKFSEHKIQPKPMANRWRKMGGPRLSQNVMNVQWSTRLPNL
jgi:hypothetical protein